MNGDLSSRVVTEGFELVPDMAVEVISQRYLVDYDEALCPYCGGEFSLEHDGNSKWDDTVQGVIACSKCGFCDGNGYVDLWNIK